MEGQPPEPHWAEDWLKPNFSINQYLVYLAGCVLFSFGACCFIEAKLGTDPLDVFSLGLQKQASFVTIGMAQGGFALLMLLIWAVWNKKLPILSPFVTFFFCGSLIDFGGHYIQPMMIANQKLFGMRNHGLRGKTEQAEAAPAADTASA